MDSVSRILRVSALQPVYPEAGRLHNRPTIHRVASVSGHERILSGVFATSATAGPPLTLRSHLFRGCLERHHPRSDGPRHGRAQPQSLLLSASRKPPMGLQTNLARAALEPTPSEPTRQLNIGATNRLTDPTESGGEPTDRAETDVEWACKQTSPEPPRNDSTFVTRMCLQKTTPARDANSVTPPAGSNTPTHQPTLRQLATAAAHIFPPSATLLSHRRAQRLLHRSAADLLYAPSDLARELTARRHALPSRSMVPHSFPPTRPAPPTPLCGRRPATPSRPTVSPA